MYIQAVKPGRRIYYDAENISLNNLKINNSQQMYHPLSKNTNSLEQFVLSYKDLCLLAWRFYIRAIWMDTHYFFTVHGVIIHQMNT
ncbi:hypothetical protein DKP72_15865 [Salmonella enterica]|nr:hypothetical protein [Salmonella enterica]EAU0591255.1 hypothetical protein [Salmonella enterica]ECH9120101.1 hypothetical protein [Salmonella enterica subsp. enterica]